MKAINWAQRSEKLHNEDLIRIASQRTADQYQQEAIDAARVELQRRRIDEDELARLEDEEQAEALAEISKQHVSLSAVGWILALIFGTIIVWNLLATVILHSRGYTRKAKNVLAAIPISIAAWWGTFLTLSLFLNN